MVESTQIVRVTIMVILNSVLAIRDSLIIMSVTNLPNMFGDKMISGFHWRKEMMAIEFLLENLKDGLMVLGFE